MFEKKPVPERLLDAAGTPHEQLPPHVSQGADQNGDTQDLRSVKEQPLRRNRPLGEVVDGILDDPRDKELEDVHSKKGKQAHQEPASILDEVSFEGFESLHVVGC